MRTLDVIEQLYDQLPAQVRPLVSIAVKADPFFLRATAVFSTRDNVEMECELQPGVEGGPQMVIPRDMVARLCLL